MKQERLHGPAAGLIRACPGLKRRTARAALVFPLMAGLFTTGLAACNPVLPASYRIDLPAPPSLWTELLGPPSWRLEWADGGGEPRLRELAPGRGTEIEVPREWASPVLAYPCWPDRGIPPGIFRPAGAIFPYDVREDRIRLSWEAGPEARFYRELAAAWTEYAAAGSSPRHTRQGRYFDWPRFRELMQGPDIPEAVHRDPWLADWRSIALNAVRSGFNRQRIKEPVREQLLITVPQGGPWTGASPFAEQKDWQAGAGLILEVTDDVDTYLAPGGMLKVSRNAWIWLPWDGKRPE
ncbi:MAG: hypothetical protein LBO80_05255 [Treponema sp.]|jgi:hypothetical protein|nr:hypothetical protein [Treponema sp.]